MGTIGLEITDGVALLTVDAPEVRNGLTPAMGRELADACDTIDADRTVGAAVGAGINLMLATDPRIVARDARLLAGFLRIGLHPGGGFFTLAARTAGREATAAMGLLGEEIDGTRAAEIGLAWRAVDDADVEDDALALAAVPARDPDLAREAARSFRTETGPPGLAWDAAVEFERATQMWSQRRRADRETS